jgi:PAS domain S-box-containing protein
MAEPGRSVRAERRQAARASALREREDQYRAIFEATSDGLVINDAETGLVLEANPAFCRMHGYDQMTGLHPSVFIHPDSHGLFAQYVETVSRGGVFRTQARDIRRDGVVFDVEVLGRGFTYQGRPALLGVVRDITEQARAYQLLDQRVTERTLEVQHRVREQEALYRADESLLRSLRLDDVLQGLATVAMEVFQADKSSVLIWNESRDVVRMAGARGFQTSASEMVLPADDARFLTGTFSDGAAVFEYSPDDLPENSVLREVYRQEGIRSTLAAGVLVGGQVFGAFGVSYTRRRSFSEEERRLVLALAQRAALAIENANLYQQAQARLHEVEALAAENARLREDAERRARTNEALYQADEQLYRSLELDQVLQSLVEVAIAILGADTAGVWAVDAQRGALLGLMLRGTLPDFITALNELTELDMPIVHDSLTRDIVTIEDMATDERITPAARVLIQNEGIHAALITPIQVGDEMFGVFSLGFRAARDFSGDEQRLLQALGRRASMAITNARLYERAQQVATLEERQRLARELHDAVTQTLFSSALIAEVVPELWEIDPVEGRQRLEQLRRLTRGALAEMRSLLIELRPGALTELPLGELLQQLAEATAGRTMLDIAVSIDGRQPAALPPDVQVAVYRVAQEALTNIARHAHAHQARLCLRWLRSGLDLRIEDDGRGFDPSAVPPGHLGVGIMRERAEGIGASLKVDSAPGRGTRVAIAWRATRRRSA